MPRRRTDKLGPALDVELLLADLLARAEAGNLPLASDDEWQGWLHAWGAQHLGRYVRDAHGQRWDYGPEPEWSDMPLAVARRDAISFVELILPMIPRSKRRTAENLAPAAWARAHPGPPIYRANRGPTPERLAWEREQAAYLATHREAFDVTEAQAQAEAAATRAEVIDRFKLENLVHAAAAEATAGHGDWNQGSPEA